MKNYYFASYAWRRVGWRAGEWRYENEFMDTVPPLWAANCEKKYQDERYKIISYQKLTADEEIQYAKLCLEKNGGEPLHTEGKE